MPRRRRPDQGPPVPRIRNACLRCKEKRYKCSQVRPCLQCLDADVNCVTQSQKYRASVNRLDSSKPGTNPQECGDGADDGIVHPDDKPLLRTGILWSGEQEVTSVTAIELHNGMHDSACGVAQSSTISSHTLSRAAFQELDSFLEDPIFLTRPSSPVHSPLLEASHFYKELWFHYTEVLSRLHSPHDLASNPIIKVLAPVAQSFDPLLAVLLASSLENYRSLRGQPPDEELLGTLMSYAVSGVQKDLSRTTSGKVSDLTLATVIALCDFEIVARKRATTSSWRIHLEGAKRIIDLHGDPRKQENKSDFYQFLIKWLAYFDVMSSVTSIDLHAEPLFQGKYWLKSQTHDTVLEEDFRLDPYMGFLQDVVPFFLEVGRLTREKQKLLVGLNLREAHELHMRCRVLEHSLKDTLGTVSGQTFMSDAKARILINCHDAFVFAIMIHLYRRVEGLDSASTDVRTCVTLGLKHISASCDVDHAEIDSSLLFPLFTFGCETLCDTDRAYVLDRMTALGALGLGNVDRAIEVLISIWQVNTAEDGTSGLDWDEILRMFNWEVNLA